MFNTFRLSQEKIYIPKVNIPTHTQSANNDSASASNKKPYSLAVDEYRQIDIPRGSATITLPVPGDAS